MNTMTATLKVPMHRHFIEQNIQAGNFTVIEGSHVLGIVPDADGEEILIIFQKGVEPTK